MQIKGFPSVWSAPRRLLFCTKGNCGPLAAWGVLHYFKKRISSRRIVKMCRHTEKYGCFTIALALALRERGLVVDFYSDPDEQPNSIEISCYRKARLLGVTFHESIDLQALLEKIDQNHIPIVFYDTAERIGMFSPLLGIANGHLILPYSQEDQMNEAEFNVRWQSKGILHQCLVASLT